MLCKNLEKTLKQSFEIASQYGSKTVKLVHLLQALLKNPDAKVALKNRKTDVSTLTQHIQNLKHKKNIKNGIDIDTIEPSKEVQRVMKRTIYQAQSSQSMKINGKNLLVAFLAESDREVDAIFDHFKIKKIQLMKHLLLPEKSTPDPIFYFHKPDDRKVLEKECSMLDQYTLNLNHLVEKGKIKEIFSREEETQAVQEILTRKIKNNPMLIGEPGVGKTALVEGLAWRIVHQKVSHRLADFQILRLDIADLIAGTKYRGEFEKKLTTLFDSIQNHGKIILFIDEIHNLIGAGKSSDSTLDASNILKPLLTEEKIRVIGATTNTEYSIHFKQQGAFTRRFHRLNIKEPDFEQTYVILNGIKKNFEDYHQIRYQNKLLQFIIQLTDRYIPHRWQPDKSIDVMDQIGAQKNLLRPTTNKKIGITYHDVETIIAKITQIPLDRIKVKKSHKLKLLRNRLSKIIFGQEKSIHQITKHIQLSLSGLNHPNKPVGSFLILGPTGVGKTELCVQLADLCQIPLIRFDMSEYQEPHTISKWIGSPAGYVASEKGGILTEKIRQNPHALLLLDEIEKAHPDILNLLLQIMDYGILNDNQGESIHFKNILLIMTSNVGAESFENNTAGFMPDQNGNVMPFLKNHFTPEFRGRLDHCLVFEPLSEQIFKRIINKLLLKLQKQLKPKKIRLKTSESFKQWLVKKGFNLKLGARPIEKLIDQNLKEPLAEEILFGKLHQGGTAHVDIKNEKVVLKTETNAD